MIHFLCVFFETHKTKTNTKESNMFNEQILENENFDLKKTEFILFCKTGNFEKMKQMKEIINDENHDFGSLHCYAFLCVCEEGHLEVAQWLLKKQPNIDVSSENNFAFRWSCLNGHLETAKWLLEIKPEIFDVVDIASSFKWVCFYGHIKVAQWLLEIKPEIDISADNEFAFRFACRRRHMKVAEWLQSLRPWLYKIIKEQINKNDPITKCCVKHHINTEEEQQVYFKKERFQRRKYLVWLHSSPSLHQTSILHPLPSELLREMAMMM